MIQSAKPMISVIIPTYNRAHLVGRAIQSVLDQTYRDFEIIVVDDASIDNTEEVVAGFNDGRIRYIRRRENRGGSAARNTGIKEAKAKFIAFLDSDDEWLSDKLRKQMDRFKISSKKVGVIYCGRCRVWDETQEVAERVIPSLRGDLFVNLLMGCFVQGSTPVIRRDCFRKTGLFDEALPSNHDWDMWIRLSRYYEFDFIPQVLVKYHLHGAQMTTDLDAKMRSREAILRKYRVDLSKYPSILSSHLSVLGKLSSIKDNRKAASMYFWKAIELNPFYWANYLHLLLSILAPRTHRKVIESRRRTVHGIAFY